jgi:hypothetical protein
MVPLKILEAPPRPENDSAVSGDSERPLIPKPGYIEAFAVMDLYSGIKLFDLKLESHCCRKQFFIASNMFLASM